MKKENKGNDDEWEEEEEEEEHNQLMVNRNEIDSVGWAPPHATPWRHPLVLFAPLELFSSTSWGLEGRGVPF